MKNTNNRNSDTNCNFDPSTMSNQQLLDYIKQLLLKTTNTFTPELTITLAMMVTGLFLSQHVQLHSIAIFLPLDIKLLSIIARFERFVADPRVDVQKCFEPFVLAMIDTFSSDVAYILIDCTQAGPKCRTLVVAIAYHNTVLPIAWKTFKGKKGHLKGDHHKELLEKAVAYLKQFNQVILLGDAEFSNGTVIEFAKEQRWDFVLRCQGSYRFKDTDGKWKSITEACRGIGFSIGKLHHWENIIFTEKHKIAGLTITVHWKEGEEEPWYLVSSLKAEDHPHLAYMKRYWIETLFGNYKSRGFDLARTEMEIPSHIDRLILAIAIATWITMGVGTGVILMGDQSEVDRADRRDLSLFQIGYRYFLRLFALNRLERAKIVFNWDFCLLPAGYG